MIISQGQSCTISPGYDDATVTNLDANEGSYEISESTIVIKKEIRGNKTQKNPIDRKSVIIKNSGKTELDVANCQ